VKYNRNYYDYEDDGKDDDEGDFAWFYGRWERGGRSGNGYDGYKRESGVQSIWYQTSGDESHFSSICTCSVRSFTVHRVRFLGAQSSRTRNQTEILTNANSTTFLIQSPENDRIHRQDLLEYCVRASAPTCQSSQTLLPYLTLPHPSNHALCSSPALTQKFSSLSSTTHPKSGSNNPSSPSNGHSPS
jgi:hypothetical protein